MTETFEPKFPTDTEMGEEHSGQVRMAYRVARYFNGTLLHVHGIGWHHWTGKRWEVDDGEAHARRAVLQILRDALAESLGDKQLRADVKACESAAGISGVLQIASALVEFAVTVRDMDADPYLLNCDNGTLDLRTRQLREHDPADRLSKITTAAYRPDADLAVWSGFLQTVLPDEPERAYLQRIIGQGVAGLVREHLFPVLIGAGANGKGTCYGAICFAMGDYATVINPDILMVKDRGGIGGPELMMLRGARLVVGSETDEGRKLDEALMKRLTGGDELTARNLYQPPVTWSPTHQLLYVTNHEPKVKGNDPATWRRIRVVPFEVIVPAEQRDPGLPDQLKLHADAVLSWAIEGYFDYLDGGGMREPETVLRATDGYQRRSDPVARFVADDEYVTRPDDHGARASTRELYSAWQRFALADGAEPMSEKAFSGELERLGFEKKTIGGRRVWPGLGIVSAPSGEGW
ncbi:DNA primase family protein [Flexivirga oryzae]|uniref:Putative DNA primase/helicase n=1 Tax=Flexivirga oryzae TaxID=1794944 RepID=A0A839NJP3_9MICO|nr:phage/plasmid primase, P4 family [Flexivirga oryzae]MBB2894572.1 putative DNA primase/helicase [Flexivirga oryzae]